MDFLTENWPLMVCAFGACVYISFGVYAFFTQPKQTQIEAVKKWLVGVTYDAEIALGSGSGELKLMMVYDLFVSRFPWVAKVVSFDTFHGWVKEVLEELPGLIERMSAKMPEANTAEEPVRAIGFYAEDPAGE